MTGKEEGIIPFHDKKSDSFSQKPPEEIRVPIDFLPSSYNDPIRDRFIHGEAYLIDSLLPPIGKASEKFFRHKDALYRVLSSGLPYSEELVDKIGALSQEQAVPGLLVIDETLWDTPEGKAANELAYIFNMPSITILSLFDKRVLERADVNGQQAFDAVMHTELYHYFSHYQDLLKKKAKPKIIDSLARKYKTSKKEVTALLKDTDPSQLSPQELYDKQTPYLSTYEQLEQATIALSHERLQKLNPRGYILAVVDPRIVPIFDRNFQQETPSS